MKKGGKKGGRKAAAGGAAKRKHSPVRTDKPWLRLREVPKGWVEPLVELFRGAIQARIKHIDGSNYKLAKCSKVSPSMLGYVVKGTCVPGLEVAGQICYVDNTSLAQVLWDMLRDFRSGKRRPNGGDPHSGNGTQK